jgi:alternate signal-mediated exported protein
MNKLTKAAIAGAAGIALLLGGAGSLAYWNAADTVNAGSISTGTLELSATDGTWNTAPALWVPGDSYTYSATVSVTASGDNIKGTLSIDTSGITDDDELLDDIALSLNVTGSLPGGVTANGDGTYDIVGAGTYSLDVTVTAAFDPDSGNDTQGKSLDLSALGFKVVQHL